MSQTAEVEVRDVPGDSQYQITVEGHLAGYLAYEVQGATTVLEHTKVFDEYAGRGLATRLARYALDDIRTRGANADVQCPFIDAYINNHPEYQDLPI